MAETAAVKRAEEPKPIKYGSVFDQIQDTFNALSRRVSIRKTSGESDLGAAVQCGSRIETAREPTRQSLLLSVPAMVR